MKKFIFVFLVCLLAGLFAQTEQQYGDASSDDDIWSGDIILRIDKSEIPTEDKRGIDFMSDLKTLLINNLVTGDVEAYSDEFFEKKVSADTIDLGSANTIFIKEYWSINQNHTWFTAKQKYISFAYSSSSMEDDETLATFKWDEIEPLLMQNRVPYKSNLSSLVTYYDIFKLKLFPYHVVEILDQKIKDDNFSDLSAYAVDIFEGIVNE